MLSSGGQVGRTLALDYVPALDGLRAVAIALVMVFHADVPFLPGANLGVDIFFVLSGFLIGRLLLAEYSAYGALNLKRFYRRRLWRLMPPLVVLVALYALIAPQIWPDYFFHLRDVFAVLLYLADIALVFGDGPQYMAHTWSLGIEERFYLLLPVLCLFLMRGVAGALVWRVFLLLAVLVTAWRFYWVYAAYSGTLYYRFDLRISGLLLGVAVAWVPPNLLPDLKRVSSLFLPLLILLLLLLILPDHGQAWRLGYGLTVVELLTALSVLWIVQQPGCILSVVLGKSWLVFIGKISYGLYLFHYPVMQFIKAEYPWPVTIGVGVLVAFILAVLSWYLLEKPISVWRKSR